MSEVVRFLKIEQDGLAETKYVSIHGDGWIVISNDPNCIFNFSPKQAEELIVFLNS